MGASWTNGLRQSGLPATLFIAVETYDNACYERAAKTQRYLLPRKRDRHCTPSVAACCHTLSSDWK
jgi:hypothetical protein